MKTRLVALIICPLLISLALPSAAEAASPMAWVTDVCHSIHRDWKRNNCWPKPFVCPDRQYVRAALVTQVANGWERQNTLGDYYFGDTGRELTEAGKLRIRWILYEAPAQHRTIYVYSSVDPQETVARVNSVQEYVHELMPEGEPPLVLPTTVRPRGWPAERVDLVNRKFYQSIPTPQLPETGSAGGAAVD